MAEDLRIDSSPLPGNTWSKDGDPVSQEEFWDDVVLKIVSQVGQEANTEAEKQQLLQERLTQDPRVLYLILQNQPELLRYFPGWADRLANYGSAVELGQIYSPPRVKRIDRSDTQGISPSQAPVEAAGLGLGRTDSNGDGTASPPQNKGGDPIILFSGQFSYQVTDLEVNGRGLHFAFKRTYLHQTLYHGPLGYNWDHSYNLWLREEQEILPDGSRQNVVLRSTGQLREDKYVEILENALSPLPPLGSTADSEVLFNSPPGVFDRLWRVDGAYRLETAPGVIFEYNSELLVERIVDRNGNAMSLSYRDGVLRTVTDPVGKEFLFEYDELNHVTKLIDSTGQREITYHYGDNNDLEEVDIMLEANRMAGTDYRYTNADLPFDLQHNLLEIISPDGESVLENSYGEEPGTWGYNRVVYQRSADGDYCYEYGRILETPSEPSADPVNVPQTFTRVAYPSGHTIEHWFNQQGNPVQRTEDVFDEARIPQTLTATYRYNEDGILIEERRADGSCILYRTQREAYADMNGGNASSATPEERLAFGNLLQTVEKPRNGYAEDRWRVVNLTYHTPGNRLASREGPYFSRDYLLLTPLPGESPNKTFYDLDASGNLARIRYPSAERPDGVTQPATPLEFSYNGFGLLTDVRRGTLHTQYVYYPETDRLRSGFWKEQVEDPEQIGRRTSREVDNLGRVTRTVMPYGAVVNTEWTLFDAPNRIVGPAAALGTDPPACSLKYNGNRQAVRIEQEIRNHDGTPHPESPLVYTFRYDGYGRRKKEMQGPAADPEARQTSSVYTPFGQIERQTDFLGNVTLFRYDERMLLTAIVRGWGSEEQATLRRRYNARAELVEIMNGRGFKTLIAYDAFGRVRSITDPDGTRSEFDYDAADQVVSRRLYGVHPEAGQEVKWRETGRRYDVLGQLVEVTEHQFIPGAAAPSVLLKTQYFFDSVGRLESVRDPLGQTQSYQYDTLGRATSQTDADGNTVTTHYDDAQRTIRQVRNETGNDEAGNICRECFQTVTELDPRGLAVKLIDPLGNVTQRAFDSRELQTRWIDPKQHQTLTDFDIFGRRVRVRARRGQHEAKAEFQYDANGQMLSAISPIGGQIRWTYDALQRIDSRVQGDALTRFVYDTGDQAIACTDGNGVVLRMTYTPAGRLSAIDPDVSHFALLPDDPTYRPSSTSCEFTYTPAGSVAIARNDVATVIRRYDSLEQVVEEKTDGLSLFHDYDEAGREIGLTYPGGRRIRFDYSAGGRLTVIRQTAKGALYPGDPQAPDSRTLVSLWNVGNRPIALQWGETHRANLKYDGAQHTIGLDWTRLPDASTIFQERNLFGSRGELQAHQAGSLTRLFESDDWVRLKKATDYQNIPLADVSALQPPGQPAPGLPSGQSGIDAVVRSLRQAIGPQDSERQFGYELDDNTNRLKSSERLAPGAPVVETPYDPAPDDRYRSVGEAVFSYDHVGSLVGDGAQLYRYDAYNHLAGTIVSGESCSFFYDALGRLRRMTRSGGSSNLEFIYSGTRLAEWHESGSPQGQAVPLLRPNQYAHIACQGEDHAPIFNGMDSVVGWVSSAGQLSGPVQFDPFGQVIEGNSSPLIPFGFAGYWYDPFSRTYLLSVRQYHPGWGRFLQQDPGGLIDGMNPYAYVHHAPGTLTDYHGFSSYHIDWGMAAIAAGATLILGGLGMLAVSALVGAGYVVAATVATVGGVLVSAAHSYWNRSMEIMDSGKTEEQTHLKGAVFGDLATFGLLGGMEGLVGTSAATDNPLTSKEGGSRLGTTVGSVILGGVGKAIVGYGVSIGKFGLPGTSQRALNKDLANVAQELRIMEQMQGLLNSGKLGVIREESVQFENVRAYWQKGDELAVRGFSVKNTGVRGVGQGWRIMERYETAALLLGNKVGARGVWVMGEIPKNKDLKASLERVGYEMRAFEPPGADPRNQGSFLGVYLSKYFNLSDTSIW